jgi:hypothetical protein
VPSPAGMTGPPNGASAPAPAASDPASVEEEAVGGVAGLVGAADVFVFHRAVADRFALLGGVGRGHSWAGTVEFRCTDPTPLGPAVGEGGRPARWQGKRPAPVVGPYWASSAILVRLDEDVVVLFGDLLDVTAADDEQMTVAAARAAAAVTVVPPAKRLAEELAARRAVRTLAQARTGSVEQTMTAVV